PPASPAAAGQPTALTANVTSVAPGAPSGTVTFFANGVSLGTGTLDANGAGSLTTSELAAGVNSIVAQYDGDSHFAPGNSAALSVVAAGFAPPASGLSVAPGKSLMIPLTLYAPAGSNLSFSLSCSGLPAGASCAFDLNPVSPEPNGTAVNLTLSFGAGARLAPLAPDGRPSSKRLMGLCAAFSAMLVFAGMARVQRLSRRRLAFAVSCAVIAIACGMAGCGSVAGVSSTGPTSVPTGPIAFTVTGSSGGTAVSTVLLVTVQ
ncbi:MAG: Ig-like domain-containing protein, partial [Candidatus Acidiferrales bacterium]